ncbi:hypothetical protein MKZ38_010580 [Zalerion maritima]|uniref:Uncharacterized protein n=1 Tax=Zalerion maritima TaxID=339359 RepID=A0AAD5RSB5_9PEZI|nr:hypothetical protein MKZ38_010580 [Zalerion maritima]
MYILAFLGCQKDKTATFYLLYLGLDSVAETDGRLWVGTESSPGCIRVDTNTSINKENYQTDLVAAGATDSKDTRRLCDQAVKIQSENANLPWGHAVAFILFSLDFLTCCAQILTIKPRQILRIMFGSFSRLLALAVAIVAQEGWGLTFVFTVAVTMVLTTAVACRVLMIRMEDVWNYDAEYQAAKREEMELHGYMYDEDFNCIGKPLPDNEDIRPVDTGCQFQSQAAARDLRGQGKKSIKNLYATVRSRSLWSKMPNQNSKRMGWGRAIKRKSMNTMTRNACDNTKRQNMKNNILRRMVQMHVKSNGRNGLNDTGMGGLRMEHRDLDVGSLVARPEENLMQRHTFCCGGVTLVSNGGAEWEDGATGMMSRGPPCSTRRDSGNRYGRRDLEAHCSACSRAAELKDRDRDWIDVNLREKPAVATSPYIVVTTQSPWMAKCSFGK